MKIILSKNDKKPIYLQIVDSIKSEIMNGNLKDQDPIPSIRSLSKSLEVSVITVKKAYDELESLSLISTSPGKGSFVSIDKVDKLREEKYLDIQKNLVSLIENAKEFGISKEDIMEMIELL